MKRAIILITLLLAANKTFSQNENYVPVTTIKEFGSWASGIEARNISFDSKVLDAMYTMLSNSSEVDNVIKTSSYLSYYTPYMDRVYFILSQNPAQSRVLVVSKIPVSGLGVILRLDNEMLQAAHYFASCIEGKEQDVFNIFAGNNSKFYYSTKKGQYCRVYLDQTETISSVITKNGYLVIPAYASSFSFRYGEYKSRDPARSSGVTLKLQDNVVASYNFNTDEQGFNLGLIYSENKPAGTYRYKVEIYGKMYMGVRGPNERFRLWFECFGNDLTDIVSIDGNPQPFLISRSISELKLPIIENQNTEGAATVPIGNETGRNISSLNVERKDPIRPPVPEPTRIDDNAKGPEDLRELTKKVREYASKAFDKNRSWAVVIGIETYDSQKTGYGRLPYAVADAKAIKDYLIQYFGFEREKVLTLYNEKATRANIEKLLGDIIPRKLQKEDRILIFFSTHGDFINTKGGNYGFLIPFDGNKKELYSTAISADQFNKLSDLIPAKHKLFLIDACFSGLAGCVYRKSPFPKETLELAEKYLKNDGSQIMTAGTSDQEALMSSKWDGHSLFTYYLLLGLKGEADSNRDQMITVPELYNYVYDKVPREADQTPQLCPLSGEGHFVFLEREIFK